MTEATPGEVLAALDALATVDFTDQPAGTRGEVLLELTRIGRRLESSCLRALAAFDASGDASLDGARSTAAWLRWRTNTAPGTARTQVVTARKLAELPTMTAAHEAGEVSEAHLAVVTGAMDRSPARQATIGQAEALFAESARQIDPPGLAKSVAHWAHTVDPLDAVAQERDLHEQRHLGISRTFGGAIHVQGLLPPEPGALLLAALEAMSTETYRADRADQTHGAAQTHGAGDRGATSTTPGQRRADALEELCRRYLNGGMAPQIAGLRPHLSVTVPAATLAADLADVGHLPCVLDGVGPISGEAARRLGCDSAVTVFGLDADERPTRYGRTQRVVPAGLRRYLNLRDAGCVFPGCGRPTAWTEAHHLIHWSRGGNTDSDNLALICTRHHHELHEGGYATTGSPETGTLRFYRPDGTHLPTTGPPTGRTRAGPEPRAA